MLDPMSAYRTGQVTSTNRAGQIVLLYQGAIRFGTQHLTYLELGQLENAHRASIRCQEIVAALREALDLSVGPIAVQLDQLYDFVLRQLVAGNVAKEPKPTREALDVLRGLLDAWQQIAQLPASEVRTESVAPRTPVAVPMGVAAAVGGGAR